MWGARSEMASELEVFPQGRLIYRPVAGRLLAAIKEETKTARRVLRAFRMPKQREAIFSLLAARTLHRCAESRLLPAAVATDLEVYCLRALAASQQGQDCL